MSMDCWEFNDFFQFSDAYMPIAVNICCNGFFQRFALIAQKSSRYQSADCF
jgi:hypothetical protein